MLSHMLPVGGTVGPSKAESALGVHGSGSSQVPFTPVSSAASASLAGCQTWGITRAWFGAVSTSCLSRFAAGHASSSPRQLRTILYCLITTHSLGCSRVENHWQTGQQESRQFGTSYARIQSSYQLRVFTFDPTLGISPGPTFRRSGKIRATTITKLARMLEFRKVRVAFCRVQCLSCRLSVNCPCLFITIFFVLLLCCCFFNLLSRDTVRLRFERNKGYFVLCIHVRFWSSFVCFEFFWIDLRQCVCGPWTWIASSQSQLGIAGWGVDGSVE